MNQILRRVGKLRDANRWNEEAFQDLYPAAWYAAGDQRGALSAFLGEGRSTWTPREARPGILEIETSIRRFKEALVPG